MKRTFTALFAAIIGAIILTACGPEEVSFSTLGEKSPNKGLIVKVLTRVYDCPVGGPLWRCEAEYAIQHDTTRTIKPGLMDFYQSWLKKIEPPPLILPAKAVEATT